MFVGHAAVAFALAAGGAAAVGTARDRAVWFGIVAALFAMVPDVDMVYAVVGLGSGDDLFSVADSFWAASTVVHRGATHSVLVGFVVAGCVTALHRHPVGSLVGLGAVIGVTTLVAGGVAGGIMFLFVGGALLVAMLGYRLGFSGRVLGGAAAVGLVTHPFGDLLTGTPPPILFPVEVVLVPHRFAPFADPTLNLLLAFGVEMAAIWAAVIVGGRLLNRGVMTAIDRRALAGVGYGIAVVVVTPPTMGTSYQFVFSVLALGVVGVAPMQRRWRMPDAWTAVVTGLATVCVGAIAYTVTYLIVGG